jgi:hypothetical protein
MVHHQWLVPAQRSAPAKLICFQRAELIKTLCFIDHNADLIKTQIFRSVSGLKSESICPILAKMQ